MHPLKNNTYLYIIFIIFSYNIIFAANPEIHVIDPTTISAKSTNNITVIGKNFSDNLNLYLSSNKMTQLSLWNAVQAIEDIYVQDKTIFLACGIRGLRILQLKDYNSYPKLLGSLDFPIAIHKIFVDGNYAYVTDDKKLYLVNIEDPTNPYVKNDMILLQTPTSIFVKNNIIYLGFGKDGLQIISSKDPLKIRILSTYPNFQTYDINVIDNYLFLGAGEQGFYIFDNKTPERPLLINSFPVSGFVSSLFIENNFIFLATGKEGVQLYEISNKSNAEFLAKFEVPEEVKFIHKNTNYIYAVSGSSIFMIDVFNIGKPELLKTWKSENILNKAIGSNEYLFLIDQGGNFQVLETLWKVKNYKFIDQALIMFEISKDVPPETYDLILINDIGVKVKKNEALVIGKPKSKINYIAPQETVEGEEKIITLIGENFLPDATIKIDTTFCVNTQLYSPVKIKTTYNGNLPVGKYDITLNNPGEEKTIYKQGFSIIEKFLEINNINPESYYEDELNRKLTITGEKLDKTSKLYLWGNGPYRISNCDTPGSASSLFVANNYCFVADESAGLVVIDVSNPKHPAMIGRLDTPGSSTGLSLSRSWIYVADGEQGIQIIDVSNPYNPTFIWAADTPGFAYSLVVKDKYMYVADGKAGFSIYYMENPYNLTLVGSHKILGAVFSIAIKNNFAFIAVGDVGKVKGDGILALDITDPAKIKLISQYKSKGSVNAIQLAGNSLFIANGESGISVLDITDPVNPVEVGSYDLRINLYNIFVDEKAEYAYATAGEKGIYIFDVKFPNNPYPITSFKTIDTANAVMVKDNLAYIATGSAGIEVIDISNPSNPMQHGSLSKISQGIDIACNENIAYLMDQGNGLLVVDTKAQRLKIEEEIKIMGKPMGIKIKNNYAYIASGNEGLQIFSLETPKKPLFQSQLLLPGFAYNITIEKNLAYVSLVDKGVSIIEISNPKEPSLVSTFETKDKAYQVFIKDKYAYIADYTKGLLVADISNPLKPTILANISTKGYANDVYVKDNYAYVAASDMGLVVIDIKDPKNLKIEANCKIEGSANAIKIDGNIAALACLNKGVFLIDISNPKQPVAIGNYSTLGNAYNLCIQDQKINVADGNFGINIFTMPIAIEKFSIENNNTISFDLPYKIPSGAYNITIIDSENNRVAIKNNIFKIMKR